MTTIRPTGDQVLLVFDDTSPRFQWSNFTQDEFLVYRDRAQPNRPDQSNNIVIFALRYNDTGVSWNIGSGLEAPVDPYIKMVVSFQGVAAEFCGFWRPFDDRNMAHRRRGPGQLQGSSEW
ncbi:hypothetical protein FA15DRAFT_172268 [Coprinopsis marcescibilis]|uniref:Uncharacterized protein n=1 Tax=Coprinopsis marcescibilis TaxID=230819 RepID=A0A5C3KH86_COPMA|nr:hypothetical protein FA15DRAFT_172268 [Coprinopsis marcescibilis]